MAPKIRRLIYQVSVGQPSKLYERCTSSVQSYAEENGIDYVKQTSPILYIRPNPFTTNRSKECISRLLPLPIFEKENAFAYFDRYDQIAIIDSDIYIFPNSPNIFEEIDPEVDFAGVYECDMAITDKYAAKILNYSQMQYGSIFPQLKVPMSPKTGYPFMNMGVMVMNKSFGKYLKGQTPAEFLARPEFQPFIDGVGAFKWSTDQTLLNWWIVKERMKVQRLHWKWNGLFTANNRISECHFVHFFLKDLLPERGENFNRLLRMI